MPFRETIYVDWIRDPLTLVDAALLVNREDPDGGDRVYDAKLAFEQSEPEHVSPVARTLAALELAITRKAIPFEEIAGQPHVWLVDAVLWRLARDEDVEPRLAEWARKQPPSSARAATPVKIPDGQIFAYEYTDDSRTRCCLTRAQHEDRVQHQREYNLFVDGLDRKRRGFRNLPGDDQPAFQKTRDKLAHDGLSKDEFSLLVAYLEASQSNQPFRRPTKTMLTGGYTDDSVVDTLKGLRQKVDHPRDYIVFKIKQREGLYTFDPNPDVRYCILVPPL